LSVIPPWRDFALAQLVKKGDLLYPRNKMKIRQEKMSELLQQEIAVFLQKEFFGQLGILTVCFVSLSDDLKLASVYISSLSTPTMLEQRELIYKLQRKAFKFQREFAKKHSVKFIPQITFFYDERKEKADKIEELLKTINEEKK
jgi:ribosome-binding factor A